MSYYHVSYCIGNLQIPSYSLPWEDSLFEYPTNLASPLRIIVEASNGASDYGKRYCYYLVIVRYVGEGYDDDGDDDDNNNNTNGDSDIMMMMIIMMMMMTMRMVMR